jgi:hypothetical protein
METNATRTLVKSAPELWELADDENRMALWLADLTGATGPVDVAVTACEPGRALAWQTTGGSRFARIALRLTEKGFGTAVAITAHHEGDAARAALALETLLDDLGSPERQPFARA